MMALPPGVNSSIGGDPFYYSLAKNASVTSGGSIENPELAFAKPSPQLQAMDIIVGAVMDDMKPKSPHWYVALLATSGKHRGNRCAQRLLDLLAEWAERDGDTATSFYERRGGYKRLWSEWVKGDEQLDK